MYSLRLLTVAFMLVASVSGDEPAPDWSKRTFSAPTDRVFVAALKSIAAQHHEVKSKDEVNKVITFHVGITAWSWGYNMVLKVMPAENNTSNVSIGSPALVERLSPGALGRRKFERSSKASRKS